MQEHEKWLFDIPDSIDTELAIKQTQKIMDFVIKKITEPKTGQKKLFIL